MPTEQWLVGLHLCAAATFVHALGAQYNLDYATKANNAAQRARPFLYAACAPAMACPVYMLDIEQYAVFGMAIATTLVTVLLIPELIKTSRYITTKTAYLSCMAAIAVANYIATSASVPEPLIAYVGFTATAAVATMVQPAYAEAAHAFVCKYPSLIATVLLAVVLGAGWLSKFMVNDSPWWPILGPTISTAAMYILGLAVRLTSTRGPGRKQTKKQSAPPVGF